jgi:hypothetical protein
MNGYGQKRSKGVHMAKSTFLEIAGIVLSLVALTSQSIEAQDNGLSRKVSQFLGENGQKYIQPAVSSFSANLNSAIFQTGEVHGFLGFEVGLVGMLAPVPDDKKTFQAILPDSILYQGNTYFAGRDYDQYVVTPTALGSKTGGIVNTKQVPPKQVFQFLGGTGLKMVPLIAPQLRIGVPLGTEVIMRYVPEIKLNEEVGKLQLIGFGLKHSISQWLSGTSVAGTEKPGEFPLDISVGLMYQEFSLKDSAGGDFIKTKVFAASVQASKKFLLLTIYGGVGYETATTDISYLYQPATEYAPGLQPLRVKLEGIKGDNTLRITGGLKLHLFFLDVFADYSVASQPVASGGVTFSF